MVDLAKAHVAAVDRMTEGKMEACYEIFNIGTGTPLSVLELVNRFMAANGVNVPYVHMNGKVGVLVNLAVDISYHYVDPRMRGKG